MIGNQEIHSIDSFLSSQVQNPQFVVSGIREGVKNDAPIIANIMLDGKNDGSITTDYPAECAEIFMLLINIWINPALFKRTYSETISRLKFLQHMMKVLGVDIVSDLLIAHIMKRYDEMEGFKKEED